MAAEGKLLAEIEKMFFLVGILQEQSTAMNKELLTLNSKTNNSAECIKDSTDKESAAEPEMTSLEPMERKEGVEKVQAENTNQKFILSERKEEDLRIINLRKMRKMKKEVPGVLGTLEFKRIKKHDWDFLFEYGRAADLLQQLLLNISDGRKFVVTLTELLRDLRTNKKDYQQNRQRETNRELRASDVRSPG